MAPRRYILGKMQHSGTVLLLCRTPPLAFRARTARRITLHESMMTTLPPRDPSPTSLFRCLDRQAIVHLLVLHMLEAHEHPRLLRKTPPRPQVLVLHHAGHHFADILPAMRHNRSLLVLSIPVDHGAAPSVTEQRASNMVAINVVEAVSPSSSGYWKFCTYDRTPS